MDKKLKKKVESLLISAMEGVLSRINGRAFNSSKKKIKEAGKMVAKRFVKTMDAYKEAPPAKKEKPALKPFKKPVMPKRDGNGKFMKRK